MVLGRKILSGPVLPIISLVSQTWRHAISSTRAGTVTLLILFGAMVRLQSSNQVADRPKGSCVAIIAVWLEIKADQTTARDTSFRV
jgi:hypothetical protein